MEARWRLAKGNIPHFFTLISKVPTVTTTTTFYLFVLSQIKLKCTVFFFIIIVEYWLPEITIGARRASQPVIY